MTPDAVVTWAHDVFGNAVATASFQTLADNLVIDSVTELQHNATAWPVFDVAASAVFYPFRYSDDDWIDLGALTIQQSHDPAIPRTRQGGCGTGRGPLSAAIRRTRLPCSRT